MGQLEKLSKKLYSDSKDFYFFKNRSMKKMTCKQLGGACDHVFHAETFEEMAELSKNHGIEMMQAGDSDHIQAMQAMMKKMQNPEEMNAWFEGKRDEFEALPHE